jgi:hypothetical protein
MKSTHRCVHMTATEVLELTSQGQPLHWNELYRKTRIGSSPLTNLIKSMVASELLYPQLVKTQGGRKVKAYKATEKGLAVLHFAKSVWV